MAVMYQAKLPERVPDSVNVYRLAAPKISNAALTQLAKRCGLTGKTKEFLTTPDSLTYSEGRYTLEVRRDSGALIMQHADKYTTDDGRPFELSDRRCAAIARRFVERAKLFPMRSAQLLRVTHLRAAEASRAERKITERVLDAGVVYGRVVDGLPVIGSGGMAMVNIGPGGDVVGLRNVWRPLGRRTGRVRIRPPRDAVDAFEKIAAGFKGETTVVKAQFGYFELGPLDRQRVLEPVYALVYVVRYGEVAHKSAFVMHAGNKAFGDLMGKKRFAKAPQRTRPKPRDSADEKPA
jgi:hypothetical protein